jgi:hypothetical protein
MSSNAPAGWFQDPEHPEQLRYWDGVQWTEHRSPMPAGTPAPTTTPPSPATPVIPVSQQGRGKGTWWQWTLGVLVVLMVLGALGDDSTDTEPASNSFVAEEAAPADDTDEDVDAAEAEPAEAKKPAAKKSKTAEPAPAPAPKPAGPRLPLAQKRFMAAVTKAQDTAENADNDLQLGGALSTRNKTICDTVGRGAVRGWVGEVSLLDANGEGKGILEIELADDVHVGTWNNFLSDAVDNTLIEAGPLFDKIINLEEGQRVRFSGELVEELGGDPCINDSRMTLYGKVSDPAFIFRFSDVRPIG